jgi:hypothetical protein
MEARPPSHTQAMSSSKTSSIFHVQFFLKSLEIGTTALPLYATASDIAIIDFGVAYSKNAELFGHSCCESYY